MQKQTIANVVALCLCALLLAGCGAPQVEQSSSDNRVSASQTLSQSLSQPESEPPEDESKESFDFESPEAWQGEYPPALCTGWHASPVLGSGFSQRFLFLADGTFYFSANQMKMSDRVRYMDGTWRYEEGLVYLELHRKVVIEGGEVTAGEASYVDMIKGGVYRKYELEPDNYEHLQYTVEQADPGADSVYKNSILLGETQYWDAHGVGYDDMPDAWDTYEEGEPS